MVCSSKIDLYVMYVRGIDVEYGAEWEPSIALNSLNVATYQTQVFSVGAELCFLLL